MKIDKLIKELQKYKKDFGNLEVVFNERSVNSYVEPVYSQHPLKIRGAYKILWNEIRNKKVLVLDARNPIEHNYENEIITKGK